MEEFCKKPSIRFSGFTDDWEQRKLGKHAKLITKGTTPKDKSGNGDINFIKVENIDNGVILPTSKTTIEEHENYLKRSILKVNDILFSIAGTLGRTAIVPENILPANTNQALAIIRDFDFDTRYLLIFLEGKVVKDYIRKNPTVGAQPNLSLEQVGNLKISSPKIEEQIKLGLFFDSINKTITLHQRKLKEIESLKKTLLNKLFPNDGKKIPDYRFTGFNEDWEQRKLWEQKHYISDGNYGELYPKASDFKEQGVPFIRVNAFVNGYLSHTDLVYITQEQHETLRSGHLKENDILITTRGQIGKIAIVDESFDGSNINAQICLIRSNEDMSPLYLHQYLQISRVQKQISSLQTGTALKQLPKSKLDQILINYPEKKNEQSKIGCLFRMIDDTITLHQRKTEQLELLKKYLLKNMFV